MLEFCRWILILNGEKEKSYSKFQVIAFKSMIDVVTEKIFQRFHTIFENKVSLHDISAKKKRKKKFETASYFKIRSNWSVDSFSQSCVSLNYRQCYLNTIYCVFQAWPNIVVRFTITSMFCKKTLAHFCSSVKFRSLSSGTVHQCSAGSSVMKNCVK